jgi:hypothetical protein
VTWTNEFGQQVGDPVPGWTTRPTPRPVRLEGRYVVLEPLATGHAADLHAALCRADDEPLWTYRPTGPPADVPGMERLIEEYVAAPGWVNFALVPVGGRAQGVAA